MIPAIWPCPRWIAHRGAGTLAPENTLAAFRVGAGYGYRCFECDVKLSADGVPFLLHDATLERTSNGVGAAGEHAWAELSRLDAGGWHSARFAGEPLAHLDAIAAFVRGNGFGLNIEIKPTPGTDHATGLAVGLACLRLWQGAASWPVLSSFRVDALRGARDGAPVIPRALLLDALWPGWLEAAQALGCAAVVSDHCLRLWQGAPSWPVLSSFRVDALRGARDSAPAIPRALLLDALWPGWLEAAQALGCAAVVTDHRLLDAALVARLHGAGLRALVYTVNDAATAQRLLAWGVDAIITDAVDRFPPGA